MRNDRFIKFLSHLGAATLILAGTCLSFFSCVIAFGWGIRTMSAFAAAIAVIGYAVVFAGYKLLLSSDWQLLAAACLKGLLLVGSTLLIPAITASLTHFQNREFPFGYFAVIGFVSLFGYLWFRRYANH